MAILSHADYNFRWTAPSTVGFGQTVCPPCYLEYLQREIYKQDYLDLFLNVKTFYRTLIGDKYYVKITGCPILGGLGIPNHEIYTIFNGIDLCILVDYEYPWSEEELKKERCIKYVMIGEAAPQQNPKIVGYGMADNENSFFYNKLHLKNTNYFTEPCIVFDAGIAPLATVLNKRNSLLEFANKGVILFDIYPFAISYSTPFRTFLTVNLFYDDFIDLLTLNIALFCHPNELKFALIGPTTTTTKFIDRSVVLHGLLFGHYIIALDILTNNGIADLIHHWTLTRYHIPVGSILPLHLNYHHLAPHFLAPHPILLPTFGHTIVAVNQLSIIHKYRLIAVPMGLTGPHRIALAFAFDL
jgi:hypothetical protein